MEENTNFSNGEAEIEKEASKHISETEDASMGDQLEPS